MRMECASPSATVPASEVREQLSRILSSASFRKGARLSSLLRYLVEAFLEGSVERLKESVIGTEVFERPSFDPRLDTVVRSTARNLRFKLDEYYRTDGTNDGIVIGLPKGTYVPVFRPRRVPAPIAAGRPGHRWAVLALLLVAVAIGAAGTCLFVGSHTRPAIDSLAVLPFENKTGSTANQYWIDGLADGLTTTFVRIPGLRVISQNSATTARTHSGDVRKIGSELNAVAVLSGAVERAGNAIRVAARLERSADGGLLWSGTFQTQERDSASLERLIVQAAAHSAGLSVPDAVVKVDTPNTEAHDLYIQGRYLWSRRDPANVQKSVIFFNRALEKDPNYALAFAGLADAYGVMAANGIMPYGDALSKAEASAARALALDPQSAEAHASLGLIQNAEWDWKGAELELRAALKLNPTYATTYQRLALSATVHARFDEAIAQANKIRSVMPGAACNLLQRAYFMTGMMAEARQAAECEYQGNEGFSADLTRATLVEDHAVARSRFRGLTTKTPAGVGPFLVAWTAARLDLSSLALEWLDKAYAVRDPDLASLRVEPALDALRNEPHYKELVKKVGLGE